MKKTKCIYGGAAFLAFFAVWTALIRTVDVRPIGPEGTSVGFAAVNGFFRNAVGVNMTLYTITDWLGLVPIAVCLLFAGVGFRQLVRRKSLFKVDRDLIVLGVYYLAVLLGYLLFEMIPVNYRPVLIDGRLEASYPSSTTLLVLCVMPTLAEQAGRRLTGREGKWAVRLFVSVFSAGMVVGRLLSGVHWLTDILGSVWLSAGLYCLYQAFAKERLPWNFTKNCRN